MNAHIFVGKSEWRSPLGGSNSRWVDIILKWIWEKYCFKT
jgi:hypothetical protein